MTIPFKFQLQDVRAFHKLKGRVMYAADMGLGKSFASLLYAIRHPEIKPILVICPASLRWNWLHEVSIHTTMRAEVLQGTKPKKHGSKLAAPITIINYDILKYWLPRLKRKHFQLVIVDESQMIGGRSTQRTKAVTELCEDVPHVLALSGTPLVNRPAELWPTLHILWPKRFPSFYAFAMVHCNPRRTYWGWDFSGASRLDQLHKKLIKLGMIRRRKKDVLKELPKKQRTVIPLDISSRKEYNHALNDFLGWLTEYNPSKVGKAEKAQRLVQLGYLKRLAAELKLPSIYEWLDNFLASSDEKLIVFGIHKKILKPIFERYEKISVLVDGSVAGHKRQVAFEKFLRNKKIRLCIGNIKAAGVGWSAKSVSNVALVEVPWAPGNITQAEDRCYGIGRGQKGVRASIWFLIARDTIEEKLVKINQDKQKILDSVLDAGNGEDFDIFDRLCHELMKGNRK